MVIQQLILFLTEPLMVKFQSIQQLFQLVCHVLLIAFEIPDILFLVLENLLQGLSYYLLILEFQILYLQELYLGLQGVRLVGSESSEFRVLVFGGFKHFLVLGSK